MEHHRAHPRPRHSFGSIREAIRPESRGSTINQQINGTQPENAHVIYDRAAVNQAAGMISVQLEVPIPAALLRLQAYAADHGQTVAEVAADVVARRLRFGTDGTD
ncbi:ANTAR domain-containing protein [Catenulispora pinisilvae]|uniref:ANTAR domain-containing protein n=1 Tax=Catenulispora pinisilvae TaxID=2705253 RepID=UPI001892735C|nr:ANTAR domain-containing protein [Catenulispora pinisilvae]